MVAAASSVTADRQRAILGKLRDLLWTIGSANDAQDHGSRDEAVRMRKESCAAIRALMAEHDFLAALFPTLDREVDSGHILGFGWAQLSDRLDILLMEAGTKGARQE